jgi:hypothetical protein
MWSNAKQSQLKSRKSKRTMQKVRGIVETIVRDLFVEINSHANDSPAIRKCEVFAEVSEKILQHYMPEDCQKVIRIGMLAVRQDYQG